MPTTSRRLRLVDETNFREFRKRWSEIDRLWQACGDPEHWNVIAKLRQSARDQLRAEMRDAVNVDEAKYMIAV